MIKEDDDVLQGRTMDPNIKKLFRNEIAAEGAARFGLRPEELTFIGGFQNFVYLYTREGCKYILRFTPSTLRTQEGLEAELAWIQYLAENGMAVSESLPSAQGIAVERIPGETISFFATSFKHAPGRKIGYPECLGNPGLYEQCGRLTGRLHELARSYKPLVKRHSWERNEYLVNAGEDSKSERMVQYDVFIEHFEQGYAEDGRQLPNGWKEQLPLFLRLREIIVFVGMNRSLDLRQPDDWTRDFLRDSRMRMTNDRSLIDDFL
ncbi:MAG: aminoglycoside phosphotransferase [Paenibacillus sp.]|jgi:hypothetical protein|nr:aminoglycoside phosphotransferase [Paenibacillus sp.]